ncbi:hypothetical protein BJ742DRAFT_853110 [Cladochytrium replicatum]|nr:hypothetical protein BJ742DRAFT_853110 [Cladochytrium replicatum]
MSSNGVVVDGPGAVARLNMFAQKLGVEYPEYVIAGGPPFSCNLTIYIPPAHPCLTHINEDPSSLIPNENGLIQRVYSSSNAPSKAGAKQQAAINCVNELRLLETPIVPVNIETQADPEKPVQDYVSRLHIWANAKRLAQVPQYTWRGVGLNGPFFGIVTIEYNGESITFESPTSFARKQLAKNAAAKMAIEYIEETEIAKSAV